MQRPQIRFFPSARRAARPVPVLCVLVMLVLMLTPTVCAENEVQVPATLTPLISPVPEAGAISLDTFDAGHMTGWMSGSNLSQPGLRLINGSRCMVAAPLPETSDSEYTITRLYGEADRLNLMNKARITAALRIEGEGEYTARLTLYSGLSVFTTEATLPGGGWYAVSADISAWHLRTAIDAVEITVTAPEGTSFSYIALGSLNAGGEASLELVDAFLTFGFTAEGGTAEYENGAYILDAGEDGGMSLIADAAREDYGAAGGITALRVVLDNAMEGGTISLAVSDAFSGLSSFSLASSCKTYYGLNTYLLPFDSDLALRAYRLSFRDLQPDGFGTDSVRLVSVSLVHLPTAVSDDTVGRLSACTFAGDMSSLTVSGTLPASTVAAHIHGTLELYEIPVWANAYAVIATDEPLAAGKISTRFSFTTDLTARQATAAVSRYAVVLRTGEEILLLDEPRFPDFPAGGERDSRSVVGLSDADAAGVFTANAANVLVDVYVDRLLGGVEANTSGRLCVRGGRYYYLDYEYLDELDTMLNFYAAADVDVYLRLVSQTDLSFRSFTFAKAEAAYFAFDVTNEDGAYMLSAVTDYIASRYPKLRGFIVGERLDAAYYNGADMSDPDAYAILCADTMRIVYNAAAPHIPDVAVLAPLGHLTDDDAAAYGDSAVDPVLFAVALSRQIEADGGMPWGVLYASDNAAEMLGHVENILGRMKAVEAAAPDALYLLWQPLERYDPDILLSEYTDRCTAAARTGARVLFLELAPLPDAETIYANLKYVRAEGDDRRTFSEFPASLSDKEPDMLSYTGVYSLYDFTASFSTLHWIAGSGCSTLTTQLATMTAGARALHAQFGSSEEFDSVSGSILCMLPAALDFTPAPEIACTLLVTSSLESTATADIVFVLGSNDDRAEYKVTVPVGQIVTVSCNLADYEKAADISSIAILVQADSPVTLDISRILCGSRTHDDGALQSHFAADSNDDAGSARLSLTDRQIATLLAAVVSTLSVFALLTRRVRNKEEEERRQL